MATNILCVHGLTGSPDELAPLAEALAAAGHHVSVPMLAGHGRDVATLAATRWHDWLASAEAALDALTTNGGPAVVVAASAGGLLALHLAATRPAAVSRVVLLATPTRLPALAAAQIRLRLLVPARLLPARMQVIVKPRGPDVRDKTLAGGLRSLPAYPLVTLGQLLDMMGDVRGRLHAVRQPVLLVHGDLDAVVSREQVDALAASLTNAARVERLDLPASAHLVGIDSDRVLLQQRVREFVEGV